MIIRCKQFVEVDSFVVCITGATLSDISMVMFVVVIIEQKYCTSRYLTSDQSHVLVKVKQLFSLQILFSNWSKRKKKKKKKKPNKRLLQQTNKTYYTYQIDCQFPTSAHSNYISTVTTLMVGYMNTIIQFPGLYIIDHESVYHWLIQYIYPLFNHQ